MNTKRPNIVYLYSEVMPYVITIMKAIRDHFNVDIHCVSWDENKKTPFSPSNLDRIYFYKRSSFTTSALVEFIDARNPQAIYVSGRMDKGYLATALHCKAKAIPVVSGSDNQWEGTFKNKLAGLLGYTLYRKYFDYLWVPGKRQFEFGKRVGFANENILGNMLSADVELFNKQYHQKRADRMDYPRTIAYVGRFTAIKGIDILIEAFQKATSELQNDWKLVLVGSGDKEFNFDKVDNIIVRGFMSTEELAINSKDWGIFCLPSYKEPWGVVVHEFAAAGLPLICADCVGAADTFIVEGYNGYTFKTASVASLTGRLKEIMQQSEATLWQMSERSVALSTIIDPVKAAYTFMSVLNKEM